MHSLRWIPGIRCLAIAAVTAGAVIGSSRPASPLPATEPGSLEVVNEAGKSSRFSLKDLAELPQTELKAKDHKGDEATYAGVLVAEVLKQAEVTLGGQLRGKLLANTLLVEAADNYRAAFSLPELDPEWTDHVVLLATLRNGEPLDAMHGPYQLVLPSEKRHSRWVRQVTRLVVQSPAK